MKASTVAMLSLSHALAYNYSPSPSIRFMPSFGGGAQKFRRGNCKVCGKKDVKAGREQGIYLCAEHINQ